MLGIDLKTLKKTLSIIKHWTSASFEIIIMIKSKYILKQIYYNNKIKKSNILARFESQNGESIK